MLYATSVPANLKAGELDNMRIIGVVESLPRLRGKTSNLFKKISFGKWQVVEDLRLISIIHKNTYFSKSRYTRELVNAYNESVQNIPQDILENSLILSKNL
ncbi:Uncharacterised protein [Chryseobacterium indologenes]|nr:Uncharacterised protein [Chryseobacterium indologenes]